MAINQLVRKQTHKWPHARKDPAEKKKQGRPLGSGKFQMPEFEAVFARMEGGMSLVRACKEPGSPSQSYVLQCIENDWPEGVAARYKAAYAVFAESMADEVISIPDDIARQQEEIDRQNVELIKSGMETIPNIEPTAVNIAKLRVESRKWILSKRAREKYGESIQQEVKVDTTDSIKELLDYIEENGKSILDLPQSDYSNQGTVSIRRDDIIEDQEEQE